MSERKWIQTVRRWLCTLGCAISLTAPAVATHAADRVTESRQYTVVATSQRLQEARPDRRLTAEEGERLGSLTAAGVGQASVIPEQAAVRTLVSLALWLAVGAIGPVGRKRPRQP